MKIRLVWLIALTLSFASLVNYAQASFNYSDLIGRWYADFSKVIPGERQGTVRLCGTTEYFSNRTSQIRAELHLKIEETELEYGLYLIASVSGTGKEELVENKLVSTVVTSKVAVQSFYLLENGKNLSREMLSEEAQKFYDESKEELLSALDTPVGDISEATILSLGKEDLVEQIKSDDGEHIIVSAKRVSSIRSSCGR